MNCSKVRPLLVHYIFQELPISQYNKVQQHLYSCAQCRGQMRRFKDTLQIMQRAPRPQPCAARRQQLFEEARKLLLLVGTRYNLSVSAISKIQQQQQEQRSRFLVSVICIGTLVMALGFYLIQVIQSARRHRPSLAEQPVVQISSLPSQPSASTVLQQYLQAFHEQTTLDELLATTGWPAVLERYQRKLQPMVAKLRQPLVRLIKEAGPLRMSALVFFARLYSQPGPELLQYLQAMVLGPQLTLKQRQLVFKVLTQFKHAGETALLILKKNTAGPLRLQAALSLPGDLSKDRVFELFDVLENEKSLRVIHHLKNVLVNWGGEEILAGFKDILKTSKSQQLRLVAVEALLELAGEEAIYELEPLIVGDAPLDFRCAVLRRAAADQRLHNLLLNVLHSQAEPYIRTLALHLYAQQSQARAKPVLTELFLIAREPAVMAAAAVGLVRMGESQIIPKLKEMLHSPDANIRQGALRALWYLDMSAGLPLDKFVKAHDEKLRLWAFLVLGDQKGTASLALLRQGLQDPDDQVAAAAWLSLNRRGVKLEQATLRPGLQAKALRLALREPKFVHDFFPGPQDGGVFRISLLGIARRLEIKLGITLRIDVPAWAAHPILFHWQSGASPAQILSNGLSPLGLGYYYEQGLLVVTKASLAAAHREG